MASLRFHCSRPNEWVSPRPHRDDNQRLRVYGRLQPMEETPGLFQRIFGRR